MPLPTDALRSIKILSDLVRYLEDELDWPLQEYGFDELTFEYFPAEHDAINRIEYEQMFDVNSLTAKQDLGALVAKGLIKRMGRARAVHYRGVE